MGKTSKIFLIFAVIAGIIFGVWATVRIVKYVEFSTKCEQHLKRAADANTVELAEEELEKAISYAKNNNLTEGVVSIFLNQPKNDVGYWYKNLLSSLDELKSLPANTSALEKTNVLMKLRETLTDDDDNGISVTTPDGISVYPNNAFFFWVAICCFGAVILFGILSLVAYAYDWP